MVQWRLKKELLMKLSQLVEALEADPGAGLSLVLPDGRAVPAEFHVTEVGRVRKDFIDCGGTVRQSESCVLQVWVAQGDVDHRLSAGKLAKIIALGASILGGDDLPVEVEYDLGVITQFAVAGLERGDRQITLRLASKHTACLAAEYCGVPGAAGAVGVADEVAVGGGCGCGAGPKADDNAVESSGGTSGGCCSPGPAVALGVAVKRCCG